MKWLDLFFDWLLFAVPFLIALSTPAPLTDHDYRMLANGKSIQSEEGSRALNPRRRMDLRDPPPPLGH